MRPKTAGFGQEIENLIFPYDNHLPFAAQIQLKGRGATSELVLMPTFYVPCHIGWHPGKSSESAMENNKFRDLDTTLALKFTRFG